MKVLLVFQLIMIVISVAMLFMDDGKARSKKNTAK